MRSDLKLDGLFSEYLKTHKVIFEDENIVFLFGSAILPPFEGMSHVVRWVMRDTNTTHELVVVERVYSERTRTDFLLYSSPIFLSKDSLAALTGL